MSRRRKFIDLKHDKIHKFTVGSRSQRDPLIADENAPQAVLIKQDCAPEGETSKEELHKYGIYFDDDYDYLQHIRDVKEAVDWGYYDLEVITVRDEDTKDKIRAQDNVGLVLPSSVFESYIEEPIGLLNKAAPVTGPRPELDPDIVAELDSYDIDEGEIFSPEDAEGLPDNFVSLLNSEKPLENFEEDGEFDNIENWLGASGDYDEMPPLEGSLEEEKFLEDFYKNTVISSDRRSLSGDESVYSNDVNVSEDEDEERDEVYSIGSPYGNCFGQEETKSNMRRANDAKSFSSSVLPRSEHLQILDAKFERIYTKEYSADQIGALDGEVIEGYLDTNSAIFKQAMETTKKQMVRLVKEEDNEDKDYVVQWVKNMTPYQRTTQMVEVDFSDEPKVKWDCESILSTYSTTRNIPKVVEVASSKRKKIAINKATGFPNIDKKSELTKRALLKHDQEEGGEVSSSRDIETRTLLSTISAISFRPPGETPDERRERKNALKELRRERRKEKKLNQLAFKEEKKQQVKTNMNKRINRAVAII